MKDNFNEMFSSAGAEVSIIPVLQGDAMMKVEDDQLPDSLPILALRNAVLFPGSVFPITIGRDKSIRLIEDAEKNNSFIGAVPQNDLSVEISDNALYYKVKVYAKDSLKLLFEMLTVTVEGLPLTVLEVLDSDHTVKVNI